MSLSSMELDRCANCNRETHDRDENKLCRDCRPSEPVSTEAFHSGPREAMGEPTIRIDVRRYRCVNGEVCAEQFIPGQPLPSRMVSWDDSPVSPRDMSFGFVHDDGIDHHVFAKDWIVYEDDGAAYPMPADVFARDYTLVDFASAAAEAKVLREHSAAEARVIDERDPLPRNVLLISSAREASMFASFARDSEAQGHTPLLEWWRDEHQQIIGIALVTRVAQGGGR